ncbi:MAG: carbohydrate-binding domain-containing protein [Eubacterium sp.]|nr:carbohydrate-binding domain-containing protein [Eubacterium sp.]
MGKAIDRHRTDIKLTVLMIVIALILSMFSSVRVRAAEYDTITFSDSGITEGESGEGYKISGTTLTIKESGTYKITGSCSEGNIEVAKELTGVTLIFDGLSLSSSTTAPVVIKKSSSAVIQLNGTNSLYSKEDPTTEDTNEDFEGAAIKVKSGSTLTITGSGSLNVDASTCKNGIKGGSLATINMDGGTINVNASNTGIASDGILIFNGGTYNVTAGNEGLKSEPDEDDTESQGILEIKGGTFVINATDDAINAVNGLTITGGNFTINAGDDAVHSDYVTTIGTNGSTSGPTFDIQSCEEGIEGATVNLYSGSASVKSNDDGVNAANSDLTDYSYCINITGGDWYINAGGDAIDSNKDITISGGKTEAFGSENAGDSALDYDGSCTLTGGSLLVVGNSGMGQTISSGKSIVFNNVAVSNGTELHIWDGAGTEVYTSSGVKSANQVIFASADLSDDKTYSLYFSNSDENPAATATTGQASQSASTGGMGGGTPSDMNGGNMDGGTPPDMNGGGWNGNNQNATGTWKQDTTGWWYKYNDSSYAKSTWLMVNGSWYYFDSEGYMEYDCYRDGYWLNSSGSIDAQYMGSWKSNNTGWWYEDTTGWYPTQCWLYIDGYWYYFDASGYLATNTTIDGYTVDSSGKWIK